MAKSRLLFFALPAVLGGCAAPAFGQEAATEAGTQPVACAACLVVPALTRVSIEVLATVGSKISHTGDVFPIRLAAPIVVGGREVIAAGATGIGEVVHAKKSGGSGAAGELVLAARYVEIGGRKLTLRSMRLVSEGKSNIDTVNAINVGSAASPLPIGLIGFFIVGGQATVPAGTNADAKTAEPFNLPPEGGVSAITTTAPVAPEPNKTGRGEQE